MADLETASKVVFKKCREGSNPLYCEESGWDGWPKDAKQEDVLSWIAQMSEQFAEIRGGSQVEPDRSTKAVGSAQQALAGLHGRAQA